MTMVKVEPYRPDVFISYAVCEPDGEIAAALRESLATNEVRVTAWRAQEDLELGSKFIEEIENAIASCNYFLLVLSPRSVASDWCRREWLRALRLKKPMFILQVEEVPPVKSPLELEGLQYLNFRQGVAKGLPFLLNALGVAALNEVPPTDPLDRDAPRMNALAQVLFYFDSNPSLNAAGTKALVGRLGPDVLETPRAKAIIAEICSLDADCRTLGNEILRRWGAP